MISAIAQPGNWPVGLPRAAFHQFDPGLKRKLNPSPETGEKRGEPNDAPFAEVERLKKNFLHQLKRFSEGLEDLDLGFASVHTVIGVNRCE